MSKPKNAFDLDVLVAQLRAAAVSATPNAQIKTLLQKAVNDPQWVADGIGEFAENDVILFEDTTVSIWHCRFTPGQTVPAHDHQMSAAIGVYRGAERNDFYERAPDGGLRKSSEVEVCAGEVLQIGPSAIHAVGCASSEPSCGLHVYLGQLTTVERSLFDTQQDKVLAFTDENYRRLVQVD